MPSDKRQRQQLRRNRMAALRQQQLKKQRQRRFIIGSIGTALLAAIVLAIVLFTTGGSSPTKTSTSTPTTVPPVSVPLKKAAKGIGCPKLNGSSPHYTHFAGPPPTCISADKTYTAKMVTDVGTIIIKLNSKASFSAVNNFVFLAGYHFYDGTAFHRVVTNFVDQGGDPTGTGTGGPGYSFNGGVPKSKSVYQAGALAMANSGTSASDGSQFFICVAKGCLVLPPNYTYFGNVTSGMTVVNAINKDGSAASEGTPTKVHKIKTVTISVS